MRKLFFLLIICYGTVKAQGQALIIDSTRFISGNNLGVEIYNSISTRDKGILFIGSDIGNPGGIIPYFFDTGYNGNLLVGKIDSNRKISWIKVYGGSNADGAVAASQTADGGYAILGNTFSNDGNVTGFKGEEDIWLLRLDSDGNLIWEKTYGSSLQDDATSIANTPDGGFIMLGTTYGSDGDVPFHYGDPMKDDWLLLKTDSSGNIQWTRDLGGTDGEEYEGSILSIDNSYYLISGSISTDHDCNDSAWHIGVNTSEDIYILKIDASGAVLWDSSYGGTGSDAVSCAMYDTRDSTIMIAGGTTSNDYMVTGYRGCDFGDMWILKVDKSGKLIWEKTFGSIQEDAATGICMTDGGYLIYGSTFPYTCHDSTIGDVGNEDCWVLSIDFLGYAYASKVFGGTDVEFPRSITPCLNGYATVGISASDVFSNGTTNGRNYAGQNGFISYIDNWPLSVNNQMKASKLLQLYPNPTSEILHVIMPKDVSGSLTVTNSIGQQVYAFKAAQFDNKQDINTVEWADGLYIVKWQGEDGTVLINKLVKN